MNISGKIKILVLSFLVMTTLTFAQKSQLKQGNIYFSVGKYCLALKAYNNYKKINSKSEILIKRGICNLYCNFPDKCIEDMSAAHLLKSINNDRFKYSALAYFAKGEYQEAARFYKTYLNTLKQGSDEWNKTVLEIKKCGFAKNKKYNNQLVYVENLRGNINTEFDEFRPNQSPTKAGRYYFTSNRSESNGGLRDKNGLVDVIKGQYSYDMFYADLTDGNWSAVLPFGNLLNSPKHDIIQDFSPDGSVLYFLKSQDLTSGALFTDTFNFDETLSLPSTLTSLPFVAEKGDRDLHVFNDSLIIFSSANFGGFGGYDIYYSIRKNNTWLTPINFGKNINSAFNEKSPYLIKNGNTIYFSSDKPESLGGYDIFKSDFVNGEWEESFNLLFPFNSPLNDIDVEVSADGMNALFASNRISSKGGYDIYIAYFKDQIIGQLEFTDFPRFATQISKDSLNDESNKIIKNEAEFLETKSKSPPKEFISRPLFFNGDEDLLNNTNLTNLKRVSDLMLIFPRIKVLLQSNYLSEGRQEKDLYFSIKRAEKIADELIKLGVSNDRIILQGLGANFPLALPTINGIPSSLAEKINKRIDIEFIYGENENIKITKDKTNIAEQFRDTKWDDFSLKNNGVTFRIKFAEVTHMLNSDILNLYSDIIVEKQANENKYIYTVGNMNTLNEAKKIKDQLSLKMNTKPTIIAYYQGRQISDNEIDDLKEDFPQLEHWLNEK